MVRWRRDRRAVAAPALAPGEAGRGRRALPVDRRRRVGDAWPARRARGPRRDRRRAPHRPRARAPRRRARRARTRAAYRDVARPGGPGALARGRGPAGGRARSAHRGPAELAAPDAHGRDRPRGPGRAARADPRSDRRDRVRGRPRRRARRRARGASRGPRRDRGVWPADHRVDRTTTRGGADMIRSFRRFWRYLTAALEGTLDELLDPRVQIEQAIGEAKRRHALLAEQAAAVLGNERELDIRINRAATEAARLRAAARQALVLADRARANGETTRAAGYQASAAAFAGQLTVVDASVSDLPALREKASAVPPAPRRGPGQNAFALQDQLAQAARVLTQLEAAKLQERMADAVRQVTSFAPPGDTPTLATVGERIDRRFARATARGELAADALDARMRGVSPAALHIQALRRRAGIPAAPAGGVGTHRYLLPWPLHPGR